ncbi:hypothetical protein A3I48_00695 [Candidatus Daviesbacteria bacterium RIFCSPLOWO2_02_FULL_36_7]|uniref:OBG-type G domain-containing protein n=1 Tax=Candidatus Daviesbacteria bacterium RIFCSPLOWO2_02_FULL_36_7 TaxID=1797792 RepID=A0A1F5MGT3_9BACT|nr:MAG: hypothetical protein A3I48_00695 [Candidatus Daviesbacteria bacterium RIFCSPLOWO2_02_FULL_36_7]
MGIKFLKHIEKVKLLLHCISSESEDVLKDYQVVSEELKNYNPKLLEKEEIIILTKTDLVEQKEVKEKIKQLKKLKKQIIPASIHDWNSLQKLQEVLL